MKSKANASLLGLLCPSMAPMMLLALLLMVCFSWCSLVSTAQAKEIVVEATGEYIYAPPEDSNVGRYRALAAAKEEAVNHVGEYLQSHSLYDAGKVTEDDIRSIMADFVKVKGNPAYEELDVSEGRLCRVSASFVLDDRQIEKIKELSSDNSVLVEARRLQSEKEKLEREMAALKAKGGDGTVEMDENLRKQESFQAVVDSRASGLTLAEQKALLRKAIELDPRSIAARYRYVSSMPAEEVALKDYEELFDLLKNEPQVGDGNEQKIFFFDTYAQMAVWLQDFANIHKYEKIEDLWRKTQDTAYEIESEIDWSRSGFDKKRMTLRIRDLNHFAELIAEIDLRNIDDAKFLEFAPACAEKYFGQPVKFCRELLTQYHGNRELAYYHGILNSFEAVTYAMCGNQTRYNEMMRQAEQELTDEQVDVMFSVHKKLAERFLMEYYARHLPVQ